MANILNIAANGLNAFQAALDTTGNNIANVNTEGYSRQRVDLTTRPSQKFGSIFVGSGVQLDSISRINSEFATLQLRETLSSFTQFDTFYQNASMMDRLLSQQGTDVAKSLSDFFSALEQVNETPDSVAARNVFLNQANVLAEQFNSIQGQIDEYRYNARGQLQEVVQNINSISQNIAEINLQMLNNKQRSPDLLDQRDQLIKELAQYTQVSTVDQGDGTVNVSIGVGEAIVVGTTPRTLSVGLDPNGTGQTEIFLNTSNSSIAITQNMQGGMIGGLVNFDNQILENASHVLGQMAIGLAIEFNTQHTQGLDLNGQLGGDFFTDFNSPTMQTERAIENPTNTGTGVLAVSIDDLSQLQTSNYEVTITAANQARVTRLSDGQVTNLTFTDSPPTPPQAAINIDGLSVTVDNIGNFAIGDRYTLVPTYGAASDLQVEISDPKQIAMAAVIRTTASLNNTGEGAIILGQVSDINSADLNKEFRIDFISPTQYNIVNVTDAVTTGPHAFTPNTDNVVAIPDGVSTAYSVTLSGMPQTGDSFTAEYNSGGIGDNRNGFQLSSIQTQKSFEGGLESIFDRYSRLITDVGSRTHQAQLRMESADILHKQAIAQRESVSGVNLDEEAANLLRFQQAYQAAAQLVVVANEMMDILFGTFR